MAQPFDTVGFDVESEADCRSAALLLIGRSAWFEVTPLPGARWMIETKPENAQVATHFGARVQRIARCAGCS